MAQPLSRQRLGPRQGAWHQIQYRRRPGNGVQDRCAVLRSLVGLPFGGLGALRHGLRGLLRDRRLRAGQLPVFDHGQCRRQTLSRRRRRYPQLHVRQVRPHHPGAAGPVRLADFRFVGHASAAARILLQARDESESGQPRGTGRQAGGREPGAVAQHDSRVQRGGEARRAVQSERQGRPRGGRIGSAALQLGDSAREPAVRGLCRHLRHHFHFRGSESHDRRAGGRHQPPTDPRAICRR